MSLFGTAVVAIWNDITPEGRETFIEWHNREHIAERIAIPGFLRGRRYGPEYGSPQYFTLYEAADGSVLTGIDYLARLNDPTPWTKLATAGFRNTVRGVCSVVASRGIGDGGLLMTMRFDCVPGEGAGLRAFLDNRLGPIAALKGVSGVHLCVVDAAASGIETSERKDRQVDVPRWIMMVEGSSIAAVEEASATLADPDLAAHGGLLPCVRGLYRLEFSLVDHSAVVGGSAES